MTEQWIKGCAVQRIMFRDGLVLSLDDYNELLISVPFHLRLPKIATEDEEVVVIDPRAMKNEERPLFDFAGQTITLKTELLIPASLRFSDGHEIHAHSNKHRPAWELYGKYHGYVACLPRGEVRVVRHDLAEEDED